MNEPWRNAGVEPSIEDMLLDPILRLLMVRDGVSERDIWTSIARATDAPACKKPNALPANEGEPMKWLAGEAAVER